MLVSTSNSDRPSTDRPRAKGILSLLVGSPLPYHPYDPSLLESSSAAALRKRHKRRPHRGGEAAIEEGRVNHTDETHEQAVSYNHAQSEFTLFYFCDSTCRNCWRFRPSLVAFVRLANDRNLDDSNGSAITDHTSSESEVSQKKMAVQVVCVPNDVRPSDAASFCGGMGTHRMPFGHENRLALIRLLSVQRVPTVIVIRNDTGRKVTDLGMEVIEKYAALADDDPAIVGEPIEAWRMGQSGLTWSETAGCLVS